MPPINIDQKRLGLKAGQYVPPLFNDWNYAEQKLPKSAEKQTLQANAPHNPALRIIDVMWCTT